MADTPRTDKTTAPALSISRRRFTAGAAALGAASSLGGFAMPAIAQSKALKVGVVLPTSGFLAQVGQSCKRGIDIAPALLKTMGVDIEVMHGDTESSPDVARVRTEKLINDGAQVIIGAFDSGQTQSAAQVCEQRGIPLVINTAAAPQITEQGYKTVFRNFPTSVMLVRDGLALMKDMFAATGVTPQTAVFMHANDTFGMANKAAIEALFPTVNMPFKIVETISYDPKAQDLAVEVSKAKATGAEIMLVTTRANDAIMMVREMVKQRYEPKGVFSPGSPGMYDEQYYKVLGKYSEFSITNVPWVDPNRDISKRVEAEFKKQFPNDRFDGYAFNVAFAFEAALVAADAYKRAGTADPKELLEALRKTNIAEHMITGGPIAFDEKGNNVNIRSAAVQNRNGRPTVVLPKESAEMAPVFPVPGWSKRG